MPVLQYRALWSVPNAGPSVSTFHMQGSLPGSPTATIAAAIRAFFNSVATYLPNDASVSFDTEMTEYDEVTGTLTGAEAVTPPADVTGTVSTAWAGGTGVRIVWTTDVIRFGRRVRGATFLVPAASSVFSTAGQVLPAVVTAINGYGTTLIGALAGAGGSNLVVWSRPQEAKEEPPTPARPGAFSTVSTAAVSSIAAQLRSRKY